MPGADGVAAHHVRQPVIEDGDARGTRAHRRKERRVARDDPGELAGDLRPVGDGPVELDHAVAVRLVPGAHGIPGVIADRADAARNRRPAPQPQVAPRSPAPRRARPWPPARPAARPSTSPCRAPRSECRRAPTSAARATTASRPPRASGKSTSRSDRPICVIHQSSGLPNPDSGLSMTAGASEWLDTRRAPRGADASALSFRSSWSLTATNVFQSMKSL